MSHASTTRSVVARIDGYLQRGRYFNALDTYRAERHEAGLVPAVMTNGTLEILQRWDASTRAVNAVHKPPRRVESDYRATAAAILETPDHRSRLDTRSLDAVRWLAHEA